MTRTLMAAGGSFLFCFVHWSLKSELYILCCNGKEIAVHVKGGKPMKRLFSSSKYNQAEDKVKRKSVYLQQ